MPTNLHDGFLFLVWACILVGIVGAGVVAWLDRQFRKAGEAALLAAVVFVCGLYWPQIIVALPGWKFVGVGAAIIYMVLLTSEHFSLRHDFNAYVLPRKLTPKQVKAIKDSLSNGSQFSLSILADIKDQEAWNYAHQLATAIQQAQWTVNVVQSPPNLNMPQSGVQILEEGANARPSGPTNNYVKFLQDALKAAKISHGSGTIMAGAYKLSLMVAPRPLRIQHNMGGLFFRIGTFFNQLGHKFHR